MSERTWGENVYRVGNIEKFDVLSPDESSNIETQKKHIEPWLAAVFQSEHLGLLLGSGFTTAVSQCANLSTLNMTSNYDGFPLATELKEAAQTSAKLMGRGEANIEDQIRCAMALAQGLEIMLDVRSQQVSRALDELINDFLRRLLKTERDLRLKLEQCPVPVEEGSGHQDEQDTRGEYKEILDPLSMLVSFLLSFSSRSATRERLQIFTTNYDRLIEYGADLAGLHLLDRFVGHLEPLFRSSRLDIDMHYSPPGIRGEPRYLEGVARLTKLHGSLDWVYHNGYVRRVGLPFGAEHDHPLLNESSDETVMIYPNSFKDRETAEYPYVELFRDYAAAICRPNSALVTYGYGFGDEHVNRNIADMLTIPSTHLVIISYSNEANRIKTFCSRVGTKEQISLLIGPHFGAMPTLVEHYLPKPAMDRIIAKRNEIFNVQNLESDSSKDAEPTI